MMPKDIGEILIESVSDENIQKQWSRQLSTAEAISERHAKGYDTVLLADEVGMGKTYVALATMAHYVFQTKANDRKVLLVVPPNNILSRKWEQDIRSFNESYLQKSLRDGDGTVANPGSRLRPMLIKNYWQLINNLHDYKNQDLLRITEGRVQCFAYTFWRWVRDRAKARERNPDWAAAGNLTETSPQYLDFCTDFSTRAIFDFLDMENQLNPKRLKTLINKLKSNSDYLVELKEYFRRFGKNQDGFESNIFIIGMAALRSARIDIWESKLLNTYIVGMALKGRFRPTRIEIIGGLEGLNLLMDREKHARMEKHVDWVDELSGINLWGLQEDVRVVLDSYEEGEKLIDRLLRDEDLKNHNARLSDLLKEIQAKVIARKLQAAGIGLAVVDEVHNWKNGGNGANHFKEQFAPWIAKKLILSATPFQIHEEELSRVFGYVSDANGESMKVVNRLIKDGGIAKTCLTDSREFVKCWEKLTRDEMALLHQILGDAPHGTAHAIEYMGMYSDRSEALGQFTNQVNKYHASLLGLQQELSKIMIRHTKDRNKRHFHAGMEYSPNGSPDYTKVRRMLYEVPGFGDTESALLNFLAMRVSQLVSRCGISDGKPYANVHLMGGLTSSNEAFRASSEDLLASQNISIAARKHLEFFEKAIANQPHPKVKLTVERAYENYCRGHKTLIFCERIATLKEIYGSLNARLEEGVFGKNGLEEAKVLRKNWLARHETVEFFWAQSYLESVPPDHRLILQQKLKSAIPELEKHIDLLRQKYKFTPSERQAAKLWDLGFSQVLGEAESTNSNANKTLAMLGEIFQAGDEALKEYLRLNIDANDLAIDEVSPQEEAGTTILDLLRPFNIDFSKNIWFASPNMQAFHQDLWKLIGQESSGLEKDKTEGGHTILAKLLLDLPQGLRKVLLRTDLMPRFRHLAKSENFVEMARVLDQEAIALERDDSASNLTPWGRMHEFLKALLRTEGSINRKAIRSSKRQSLWKGVFLREELIVNVIQGETNPDTRVSLCAAFNSPLAPDILICTSIGSEGIDLHLYCADIIHHDLPWNPAKLEQRTGRIDRVGSLAESEARSNLEKHRLNIGIPFLAHNYEKFQYELLFSRAQKFEILLGRPEFASDVPDEDVVDDDGVETKITDPNVDVDSKVQGEASMGDSSHLPECLIEFLRMDLSVSR